MVVFPGPGRRSEGVFSPDRPGAPARGGLFSTRGWSWKQWLALGVCFGLGHGITERLLKLRSDDGPAGVQNFGMQAFPGQPLETLRRRHGGPVLPLRADLEALEQDKRLAREKAEAQERQGDLEAQQKAEQEQAREEAEQRRLEALDRRPAPEAAPATLPAPPAPAQAPPTPELPAAGPTLPPLPQAPPPPGPVTTP